MSPMKLTTDTASTFEATVIEYPHDGRPDFRQTATGGAKTTAAWLRSLANEIDPPPAAQPQKLTCRCAPPARGRGGVGPAVRAVETTEALPGSPGHPNASAAEFGGQQVAQSVLANPLRAGAVPEAAPERRTSSSESEDR